MHPVGLSGRLVTLLMLASLLPAAADSGAVESRPLELDNQVVCRINIEAISKRDVEEQMAEIVYRLKAFRQHMEAQNAWNADAEQKYDELYGPAFLDALRRVVRERLMLQHARLEPSSIDEKAYERRCEQTLKRLRAQGHLGAKGLTAADVRKAVRENMLLDSYRTRFWALDPPTRPEVQEYYQKNIDQYQRKEGVKIRLVCVERFPLNPLTGRSTVRENAYELIEELRKDVVLYGARFEEIARAHTDDALLRERGGLLLFDPKDPYIEPNSFPQVAEAIRGLRPGEVSKVFAFDRNSWAFALVEDRRPAGPMPLEGELYEQVYKKLQDIKSRKKEDEWFRNALKRSLITRVVDGVEQTLPSEFFFDETERLARQ